MGKREDLCITGCVWGRRASMATRPTARCSSTGSSGCAKGAPGGAPFWFGLPYLLDGGGTVLWGGGVTIGLPGGWLGGGLFGFGGPGTGPGLGNPHHQYDARPEEQAQHAASQQPAHVPHPPLPVALSARQQDLLDLVHGPSLRSRGARRLH